MISRGTIYGLAVVYSLTIAVALGFGAFDGFLVFPMVIGLCQVWFNIGRMSVQVKPPFNTPEYVEYLAQQEKTVTRQWGREGAEVRS
jgi:hypothetical protein